MCKIELYKNLTKWSYFLLLTHVNVRLISDPLFSCSSLSDKSDFDRSVNFVMDQIREPGFFYIQNPALWWPYSDKSVRPEKRVRSIYLYPSPNLAYNSKVSLGKECAVTLKQNHAPKMKVISDMCKFLVRTIFPPTPLTQSV